MTKLNLKACPTFQSLRLQRQKFLIEYCKDFNGTQAAIRAKYSKKSANEQAAYLLAIPSMQEALSELKDQLMMPEAASVEEILGFWTAVLRANPKDVLGWNENGLAFTHSSEEMDDKTARLIKKVKVTEKTSQKGDWTESKTEVELHDAMKASEYLGNYRGLLKNKLEHSGFVGIVETVKYE